MNDLARAASHVKGFQVASQANRLGWEGHERLEGRAGMPLTVTAVAEPAACWLTAGLFAWGHSTPGPPGRPGGCRSQSMRSRVGLLRKHNCYQERMLTDGNGSRRYDRAQSGCWQYPPVGDLCTDPQPARCRGHPRQSVRLSAHPRHVWLGRGPGIA